MPDMISRKKYILNKMIMGSMKVLHKKVPAITSSFPIKTVSRPYLKRNKRIYNYCKQIQISEYFKPQFVSLRSRGI